MSSVDSRVVDMRFNNGQFEAAARKSLGTMDALKKGLNFDAAAKGLGALNANAAKADLSPISKGAEAAQARISMLATAAGVFLGNIATQAVRAGSTLVKALTVDAKTAGFQEYELKLGSIQTILANTQKHGTKLSTVNKVLNELNEYADKTIYNFGDMTRNIALFTNAGLGVKTATSMIKGFSNEAAASGTSATAAAGAAYQLSQALSAGTVRLMDWRSLTNVGMGNKNMQQGLIDIADAMGVLNKKTGDAKTIAKDFNGSLEKNWLSAKVMSNYLKIMSGDMSKAEMAAIGLSKAQIKAFQQQQKTAFEAATMTRTFTQLWGQMQEAAGSGWGKTFEIIIGDFNQATKTLSALNDTLVGLIDGMSDQRNEMLSAWAKAGGRTDLIAGLSNIGTTLLNVLRAIGKAWQEVFPPMTGKQLADLTKSFRNLTENLKIGDEGLNNIQGAAKSFFSILKLGVGVLKWFASGVVLAVTFLQKLAGIIYELLKPVGALFNSMGGGFSAPKSLDDLINKLIELREKGLQPVFDWMDKVKNALANFNTGGGGGGGGMGAMAAAGERIREIWMGVVDWAKQAWATSKAAGKTMAQAIANFAKEAGAGLASVLAGTGKLGDAMKRGWQALAKGFQDVFKDLDINTIFSALNTGVLVGIVSKMFKSISAAGSFKESMLGAIDNISGAFEQLTATLKTAQNDLKANILLKIAVAIAVLAAAMMAMSKIDPNRLTSAAIGMGTAMAVLLGAVMVIGKIGDLPGITGGLKIATTLVLLAAALVIMSKAIQNLGTMDTGQLVQGMTAMVVILGSLLGMAAGMAKMQGEILKSAVAMGVLAIALRMMAGVVEVFGTMDVAVLMQGAIALGVLMGALLLFTFFADKNESLLQTAAALTLLGIAINLLIAPIIILGLIPYDVLNQGLMYLAITLGLLVIATKQMEGTMAGAGAIALVAVALNLLVIPITALGLLPFDVVVRGIAALAGVLAILVFSVNAIQKALPGAGALIVLSLALTILAGAIFLLGQLSIGQVLTALVALAGAITIFGVAAALLTPVIPSMIGMAVAIGIFGLAVMAIGGGIMMISIGLMMLGPAAGVGAAGLQLLAQACVAMSGQIGQILAVGAAFIVLGVGVVLVSVGVVILAAGLILLGTGLTMIAAIGLAGAMALVAVVNAIKPLIWDIGTIIALGGAFAALGAGMVLVGTGGLLIGAALILVGVGLIAIAAGAQMAVGALEGITTGIKNLAMTEGDMRKMSSASGEYANALSKLASSAMMSTATLMTTANGLKQVAASAKQTGSSISQLPKQIVTATNQANSSLQKTQSTMKTTTTAIGTSVKTLNTDMTSGAKGIDTAGKKLVQVFEQMGTKIGQSTTKVVRAVSKTFSSLKASVGSQAAGVGSAILDGMVRGMANSSRVSAAARSVAARALQAAKSELGIASPSKEFEKIGKFANAGFAKGLTGSQDRIKDAFDKMRQMLKDAGIKAKDEIKTLEKRLRRLNKAKKKDKKEIKETKKELAQYKKLQKGAAAATKDLTAKQKKQQGTLNKLSAQYEKNAEEMKELQKNLEDAIKTRDDAAKSYKDQYSKLPEIDEEGNLEKFQDDLVDQIAKTKQFMQTMAELRKRGLNDTMYKELMSKGLEAQPFLDNIIESGWGGIANLNQLSSELEKVSEQLGKTAAKELYQAGVDTAQGFVDGLAKKQAAISAQMEKIADSLVKSIKKKLGIKSPSKEFEKIGGYSMLGLAKGLQTATIKAEKAATDAGDATLNALNKSLQNVNDLALNEMDLNPTIRPVLDLSDIQRGAGLIDGLLDPSALSTGTTYSRASAIALAQREQNKAREEELVGASASGDVIFNQYNNSPKALSPGELYRQTKNQLSAAKGKLPT